MPRGKALEKAVRTQLVRTQDKKWERLKKRGLTRPTSFSENKRRATEAHKGR